MLSHMLHLEPYFCRSLACCQFHSFRVFLLAGYCAYLDVENALDFSLMESMGIDTENLLISHPDCAENLLSMVVTLTKSGAVDVIVIDSVSHCILSLTPIILHEDLVQWGGFRLHCFNHSHSFFSHN